MTAPKAVAELVGAKHGHEGAGSEVRDLELAAPAPKRGGEESGAPPCGSPCSCTGGPGWCRPRSSCSCAGGPGRCGPPGGFQPNLVVALVGGTALPHTFLVAYFCTHSSPKPSCREIAEFYLAGSVLVTSCALVFVHCTKGSKDSLTTQAKVVTVWTSVFLLLGAYQMFMFCEFKTRTQMMSIALFLARSFVLMIMDYKFAFLVQERLRLTEAGFGVNLGSRSICCVRTTDISIQAVLVCIQVLLTVFQADEAHYFWPGPTCTHMHYAAMAVSYLAIGVIAFRGFTTVLRTLRPQVEFRVGSYVMAEKRWAVQVLQLLRWATLVVCGICTLLPICLSVMLFLEPRQDDLWRVSGPRYLVIAVVAPAIFLVEFGFLLVVTGRCRPQRGDFYKLHRRPKFRPPTAQLPRPEAWTETVRALAGRSLDTGQLLDFYESLGPAGRAMRHYKPQESTTADVVRQAVIPLTRGAEGGVPYTALLRPRQGQGMPVGMVTHTWSGRFLHLVAAVVADALDRDEYDGVAGVLASGRVGELRAELEAQGTLGQSYWICVFCVNQHSSICNSLGAAPAEGEPGYDKWDRSRRDTVTGEVFPICNCSQPKHSNSSLWCEMNKFDDMIELLSTEVPDLQHLVAVDTDFSVFTRAWCVAELHRAHFMGIPQRVCLQLNRVLDLDFDDFTIYRKLAVLSVAECEASRPEDTREILRRISDVAEFDGQLQEVIFGSRGLLRKHFIGFGLLEAVARTALRIASVESSSTLETEVKASIKSHLP